MRAYSHQGHGPRVDQTGRIHISDFRNPRTNSIAKRSRSIHTGHKRVREPSLLVQNPNKLLDPFKRLLIAFAGIHNAIPIALQGFRFHFAQAAGQERRSNGLGSGV